MNLANSFLESENHSPAVEHDLVEHLVDHRAGPGLVLPLSQDECLPALWANLVQEAVEAHFADEVAARAGEEAAATGDLTADVAIHGRLHRTSDFFSLFYG